VISVADHLQRAQYGLYFFAGVPLFWWMPPATDLPRLLTGDPTRLVFFPAVAACRCFLPRHGDEGDQGLRWSSGCHAGKTASSPPATERAGMKVRDLAADGGPIVGRLPTSASLRPRPDGVPLPSSS
jgi:hypothetical protein